MGFFLLIIAFFVIKAIFFSSSDSRPSSYETANGSTFNNWGHFTEGFYIEEDDVFVKGPVYSYTSPKVSMPNFLAFGEDNLQFKNSTGYISMYLKKVSDGRIVPIHFFVNSNSFSVIDKHGNPHTGNDYTSVSVARSLSLMLHTLELQGANENLIKTTYLFVKELLVFNMMVKRKIITSYGDSYIVISNNHISSFYQTHTNLYDSAGDTISSYADSPYSGQPKDDHISKLLKTLELPTDTSDFNVIKNQYKQLAKKYHPDRNKGTEEKMKKINVAYEELCEYFKAS